ncbi:Protein MIZU-KUSSEI 1, partial [Linum perenne]
SFPSYPAIYTLNSEQLQNADTTFQFSTLLQIYYNPIPIFPFKESIFHISLQAMTKIDALRRFLLPCLSPSTAAAPNPSPARKRISTSLRDALTDDHQDPKSDAHQDPDSSSSSSSAASVAPSRPSKTMVIGTIFGTRRGHVWLCFQHDRLSTAKPLLLLELSTTTHQLVGEMSFGLVRVALESTRHEFRSCPLRSVPVWNVNCNGKKLGFAARRKASEQNRQMLKTMQSMTVGAGVIPAGVGSPEEIMYMRANYEHVVGSADSESFHLINPGECCGQELGVFLIRSG